MRPQPLDGVDSGHTLDSLHGYNGAIARLLGATDVVIDGTFIDEECDDLLWRGSRNQRVLVRSQLP